MILSESARVTTAHEAAFRVQYPNSSPRLIKVIALDSEAGHIVSELAKKKTWNRAVFFSSLTFPSATGSVGDKSQMQAWLGNVAGHASDLVAEIDSADIVVVLASPGTDASAATIIGEACRLRHKTMIGLILQTAGINDEALSRTLQGMRPLARMLVVASDNDYVEEMLHAMRA
jgi:hypothetical protein